MSDKKKFKDTKVGKVLTDNGLLDKVMDIVEKAGIPGVSPSIAILNKVKDLAMGESSELPMTVELQMQIIEAIKLDQQELDMILKDINSARDMQKSALAQEDLFSKRFVYFLAAFWSLVAGAYMFCVTFLKFPPENTRIVDTMTGFLMGTVMAGILAYFFGSTAKSQAKDVVIQRLSGK